MKEVRIVEGLASDTAGLRQHVLGWSSTSISIDDHRQVMHLIAKIEPAVTVGCGSCAPSPFPTEEAPPGCGMRFWGVAVLSPFQGRGVGKDILLRIIQRAAKVDADYVWANARESAVSFYLDLGFKSIGEPFIDALSGLTDVRVWLPVRQMQANV